MGWRFHMRQSRPVIGILHEWPTVVICGPPCSFPWSVGGFGAHTISMPLWVQASKSKKVYRFKPYKHCLIQALTSQSIGILQHLFELFPHEFLKCGNPVWHSSIFFSTTGPVNWHGHLRFTIYPWSFVRHGMSCPFPLIRHLTRACSWCGYSWHVNWFDWMQGQ